MSETNDVLELPNCTWRRRRVLDVSVYRYAREWHVPHGLHWGDDENRNTLRIGPLCIAWSIDATNVTEESW